jgi:hypothetical protein
MGVETNYMELEIYHKYVGLNAALNINERYKRSTLHLLGICISMKRPPSFCYSAPTFLGEQVALISRSQSILFLVVTKFCYLKLLLIMGPPPNPLLMMSAGTLPLPSRWLANEPPWLMAPAADRLICAAAWYWFALLLVVAALHPWAFAELIRFILWAVRFFSMAVTGAWWIAGGL